MSSSAGMSAEEIVQLSKEYTFFSWSVQGEVNPIPMTGGEGVYFWDANGKKYLDFSSQLMNLQIGHQHPKVVKAIQEQAGKLCFAHPSAATEPRGRLGKMLSEVTPGNLKKTFFCLGGAEANENAIKIARAFTGRSKVLSTYISYHGATAGAITLTGDKRRWAAEPAIPGGVHFLNPFCYRCPFGWTRETCHRECISHLEEIVEYEGPQNIAAIFLEGVTGSNGIIIPPDDYWKRVRALCDKHGILLVSDEVMSGFGRTGKWFAVNHWDVTPDIMTMAKGITSGYVPLGAVVVSERIAKFFDDKMLWCGLTYSSHPLACAAGVATLDVYKEEGIIENAASMGQHLGKRLEDLKAKHPSVGDVRYIGLFSVIEVVCNRGTKARADLAKMKEIAKFINQHGLFTFISANMIFVIPPLIIKEKEIDEGMAILDQALAITDAASES